MLRLVRRYLRDRAGATAIEYGLVAVLISLVILAAASRSGSSVRQIQGTVATTLDDASTP